MVSRAFVTLHDTWPEEALGSITSTCATAIADAGLLVVLALALAAPAELRVCCGLREEKATFDALSVSQNTGLCRHLSRTLATRGLALQYSSWNLIADRLLFLWPRAFLIRLPHLRCRSMRFPLLLRTQRVALPVLLWLLAIQRCRYVPVQSPPASLVSSTTCLHLVLPASRLK